MKIFLIFHIKISYNYDKKFSLFHSRLCPKVLGIMKYLKLFRVLADVFLDLDLKGMKKFFYFNWRQKTETRIFPSVFWVLDFFFPKYECVIEPRPGIFYYKLEEETRTQGSCLTSLFNLPNSFYWNIVYNYFIVYKVLWGIEVKSALEMSWYW